jgi:hypothetical protein
MKAGIISDTHNSRNVHKAVQLFNEQGVDYVFHSGDIVSEDTSLVFSGLEKAKFIAVYGNCVYSKAELKRAVESFGGKIYDEICETELDGKRIFMKHIPDCTTRIIESGEYDLVIYGHTHKQDIRRKGKTLVVNPGTARTWSMSPPSVVIVDLSDMSFEILPLK